MSDMISSDIRQLLEKLNYWEQTFGTTYSHDPKIKSTGQATARIDNLKEKLKGKGVLYYWNGNEYVLDAVVEPGQGGQIFHRPDDL